MSCVHPTPAVRPLTPSVCRGLLQATVKHPFDPIAKFGHAVQQAIMPLLAKVGDCWY